MTTNTDVLISILQGGGTTASRPAASSQLGSTWRRQPSHFIAASDLQSTNVRLHIISVEMCETDLVDAASLTGAPSEEEPAPAMMVAFQLGYLGEPLTPVMYSPVCAGERRETRDADVVKTHVHERESESENETVSAATPISLPSSSTRPPPRLVSWTVNAWVELPLALSDIPLDAVVTCRVLAATAERSRCDGCSAPPPRCAVGGVTDTMWAECGTAQFYLFTPAGELRVGTHGYAIQAARHPHEKEKKREATPESGTARDADFQSTSAPPQRSSQLLHTGRLQSIPWLDLVTEQHLSRNTPWASPTRACTGSAATASSQMAIGQLCVAFPVTSHRLPVLYVPLLADTGTGINNGNNNNNCDSSWPSSAARAAAFSPTIFRPFVEHYADVHHHGWSESIATLQARSLFLAYNASALPDYKDRQRLAALLQRPPIQIEPMRVQDALLLWQYREFIRHDSRYFLPFMRSVAWTSSQPSSGERRVAEKLIPLWKPIGFADVLACLSYEFRGVHSIRAYAVRLLAQESDARLTRFAVPLLQSIPLDDPAEDELGAFLIQRSVHCWELCSALFWAVTVEAAEEQQQQQRTRPVAGPAGVGPECPFTAWRERQQQALVQYQPYFIALLRQEQRAHRWLRALAEYVEKSGGDRTFKIEVGQRLIEKRACGLKALFAAHDDKDDPRGASTASAGSSQLPDTHVPLTARLPYAPITFPTHPAIAVHGVVPQSFFMFKSATLPFQVSLVAQRLAFPHDSLITAHAPAEDTDKSDGDESRGGTVATLVHRPLAMPARDDSSRTPNRDVGSSSSFPLPPPPHKTFFMSLMYKWNDDVRQDQLVLQLIALIDAVLRLDGLDLCLTPYAVVATGAREGLIEIVPDVVTFQSVQRDVRGYLRRFHRTPESLERAMERYVQSFAGYSIITFVLGIGDRHLENILLAQDGRLLHIDFAYMLGFDPKPFAPPMKINAEMIEALGGPQSRGYSAFRSYCCSAYHTLRKHAALLLHTMQLMVFANGMPQLTGSAQPLARGVSPASPSSRAAPLAATTTTTTTTTSPAAALAQDPRASLLKVQEKLRLDLTNALATQFLQNVMADSVGSLFTNLWDALHAAAQATRA